MELERAPSLIDGSFAPRPRDGVAWVEVDGEAILWDTNTGGTHVLDPVGGTVWSCFDGTGTLDEIAVDLAAAFEADLDTVRHDVLALARGLGALGLLEGVAADLPERHHHHDHLVHDEVPPEARDPLACDDDGADEDGA